MERSPARSRTLRNVAALLLAVPLLGSTLNFVFEFIDPIQGDEFLGAEMWRLMRAGGLFRCVVVGHAITGLMLLAPRWRFLGALLQLPITIGIAAFNLTMFPPGVAPALVMLALNAVAVGDGERLRQLVARRSP